ncbi:MAG: glycosyltransferase family 4 protein [Dehalococcoidia bacterium]|nr:glycosyltransferase family 4 protein [Dehalococcoidia bacterium]
MHVVSVVGILREISDRICVISGRMPEGVSIGEGVHPRTLRITTHLRAFSRPAWLSALKWAVSYATGQIEMSCQVARMSREFDVVVFYEGAHHYVLSIIVAKVLRKKIVKYSTGLMALEGSYSRLSFDYWAGFMFRVSERISHALSDRIVVPTGADPGRIGMDKYTGKISTAMYMFVADSFREKRDWHARDNVVGYVGRLVAIKGVIQLAQAIPLILKAKGDLRFLIVGDGVLMGDMKKCLQEAGCLDRVTFVGWVPNESIPDYLNEMKFHILPSPFEAPGAINLEAMACGTIAIANGVGGILDIIIDNQTGFLVDGNEPRTIAEKVIEVWDSPDLERIRHDAADFVRRSFSKQSVVNSWRQALEDL